MKSIGKKQPEGSLSTPRGRHESSLRAIPKCSRNILHVCVLMFYVRENNYDRDSDDDFDYDGDSGSDSHHDNNSENDSEHDKDNDNDSPAQPSNVNIASGRRLPSPVNAFLRSLAIPPAALGRSLAALGSCAAVLRPLSGSSLAAFWRILTAPRKLSGSPRRVL